MGDFHGSGGGFRDREGGGGRDGGGFRGPRRDFGGPVEMHDATCTECGKACKVKFKPTPGKPVRCDDCFRKFKAQRFERF